MQFLRTAIALAFSSSLFAACSGGNANGTTPGVPNAVTQADTSRIAGPKAVIASAYSVAVFARGNAKLFNPDSVVAAGGYTYVGFQNATKATGGGGDSTIAQYNAPSHILRSINVPGRCDGMRFDPYSRVLWITVNEDANSSLFTWNPFTGTVKHYTFTAAPHHGGYDDIAFANGKAFVAASNPALNASGINTAPAVASVTLSGGKAIVSPVLLGDASARDISTGTVVKLNLTDPDSLALSPTGDVILVDQADSELIYLHNAGLATQRVSRLGVGTQLDDIAYATESDGLFYVVDSTANTIYTVRGHFTPGALYAEAPHDSGVAGFIGTVNTLTGTITPAIVGFGSPTGLIFVSDRD